MHPFNHKEELYTEYIHFTLNHLLFQEAYGLLGKTQTAMDQLLMHIASAIHNKSWNLVHVHAAMAASCNPEDLSKRPYPELCQTVTVDLFLPCLLDLAKVYYTYSSLLTHKRLDGQI